MYETTIPAYRQIANHLIEKINHGQYNNGDKLPSERELCVIYHASRITIRKALEFLEKQKLIVSYQGKGSYITEQKIDANLSQISTFSETIAQKGYTGFTKIISFDEYSKNHTYDIMFESSSIGTSELKLLGYVNSAPAVYYDSILSRSVSLSFYDTALSLTKEELAFSSFDLYKQTMTGIGRINQKVTAINAHGEISDLLDLPEGTAVLVLESFILSENLTPVEYKRGYYRTDRYTFNLYRTL